MQITLNQDEIEMALEAFVRSRITVADDQTIEFDIKAGRGDNGVSASLEIVPAQAPAVAFRKSEVKPKVVKSGQDTEEITPDDESVTPEPEPDTPDEPEDKVEGEAEDAPKGRSLFSKAG